MLCLFRKSNICASKLWSGICCVLLLQYILEDIFWSGTPLLESVGEHEPPVEELRETVRRTIQKALVPLIAYAREYEKYLELMNMDINQYITFVWFSSSFLLIYYSCFSSQFLFWYFYITKPSIILTGFIWQPYTMPTNGK